MKAKLVDLPDRYDSKDCDKRNAYSQKPNDTSSSVSATNHSTKSMKSRGLCKPTEKTSFLSLTCESSDFRKLTSRGLAIEVSILRYMYSLIIHV